MGFVIIATQGALADSRLRAVRDNAFGVKTMRF